MRSWRYRGLRRRSRSSRVISRGFSIYRIFQRWNQVRRSHVGPTRYQGAPGGWRALVPRGHWVAPLQWVLVPIFFICSIKNLQKVSSNSKNFYFCTKNNTMAILLKTASVRVSSNQIIPKPYIIICFSINCPTVICLPTVCHVFEREASSENYGPRVYFYHTLKTKIPLFT